MRGARSLALSRQMLTIEGELEPVAGLLLAYRARFLPSGTHPLEGDLVDIAITNKDGVEVACADLYVHREGRYQTVDRLIIEHAWAMR